MVVVDKASRFFLAEGGENPLAAPLHSTLTGVCFDGGVIVFLFTDAHSQQVSARKKVGGRSRVQQAAES